jgi:polyhydroxyalkanoate synthesis repressor PhaR
MAKERLIKRYTNRKLYDTLQSRYVTLDDIAKLVREGEEVRVIDNDSSEDLTAVTFAQIILEEEKRKTNLISTRFLRNMIRSGEATVQDISDAATRRLEAIGDRVREVVEEGGRAIDDTRSFVDDLLGAPAKRIDEVRKVAQRQVDSIRRSPALRREVERLEKSVHSIEELLSKLREDVETSEESAAATDVAAGNSPGDVADWQRREPAAEAAPAAGPAEAAPVSEGPAAEDTSDAASDPEPSTGTHNQ